MSDLTEAEIFSCLKDHLEAAATHCAALAELPLKGPTYEKLRAELKIVEGACRQAAHWREDSRWLPLGLQMEAIHNKCGNWLRMRAPSELFRKCAEALVNAHDVVESLRLKATGRKGTILPDMPALPRNTSVAGWTHHKGLIMPDHATVQ